MHLTFEDLKKHHQNLMKQRGQAEKNLMQIEGAMQCVIQQMTELQQKEVNAAKERAAQEHEKRLAEEQPAEQLEGNQVLEEATEEVA